jgi:hypothetical protein
MSVSKGWLGVVVRAPMGSARVCIGVHTIGSLSYSDQWGSRLCAVLADVASVRR